MSYILEVLRVIAYNNKLKQEAYDAGQHAKQDQARNETIASFFLGGSRVGKSDGQ